MTSITTYFSLVLRVLLPRRSLDSLFVYRRLTVTHGEGRHGLNGIDTKDKDKYTRLIDCGEVQNHR